ncbi:MAG: hypothetical protein HC915_20455 [Anaerolineae bacterium]|nr:hypothetical protein [Anaerolineae bacterium]
MIADRPMLAHAVDALLANIQRQNRRRGRILLAASELDDSMLRITASLTVGLETDIRMPLIYDQRLDITVARLIVEKHGGNMIFDYANPDGVQFHLDLPRG